MNSTNTFVTVESAPRTKEGLLQLTRSARLRLAMQINLLPTPDLDGAFVSSSEDGQAESLLQGLLALDAQRGQPIQHAPQQFMQPINNEQVPMQMPPGQPQFQQPAQQIQQGQPWVPPMPMVNPPPPQGMAPAGIPQQPPPQAFGAPSPALPPFPMGGQGGPPQGFGGPGPMLGGPMPQQGFAQQQPMLGTPMLGGPPQGIPASPPQGFGGQQGFAQPPMGGQGFQPQQAPQGFGGSMMQPPQMMQPQMMMQPQAPAAPPTPIAAPTAQVPSGFIEELLQALKTATESSQTLLQTIHTSQQSHERQLQAMATENQRLSQQVEFLLRSTLWMASQYPGYTPEGFGQAMCGVDVSLITRVMSAAQTPQVQQNGQSGKA